MEIAIGLAALWAVGWLVLPVGFWRPLARGNGRNWPGIFVVDPEAPCPGAVWAQEYYEARWRWRTLPLTLPLIVLGRIVPRLAWAERQMDLMGHEIEVQAEVRLRGLSAPGERVARQREARALVAHYRAFSGWTQGQVLGEMLDRRAAARRFVERHWDRIRDAAA